MSKMKRLCGILLLVTVMLSTALGGCAFATEATEATEAGTKESGATDSTQSTDSTQATESTKATDSTQATSTEASTQASTQASTEAGASNENKSNSAIVKETAQVRLASNSDTLPLFKEKKIDQNELGLFLNGTVVTVLEKQSDWTYVQIGDLKGYMQTAFLLFNNANATTTYYAYVKTAIANQLLPLYENTDTSSTKLGSYYTGTRVLVTESNNNWSKVEVDGKKGFMQTQYLSRSTSPTPVPTTSPTGTATHAVVNNPNPADRLNLRAQPNTNSASLGRFYNGTVVVVIEKGNVWSLVEVNGLRGYMMNQFLFFNNASPTPTPVPGATATIPPSSTVYYAVVNNPRVTERLNLRALPSLDSAVLGRFYNGTSVKVLQLDTIWCAVEVNGIRGYMMTQYLSFSGSSGNNNNNNNNNSGAYVNALVNNPVATQRLNLRAGPSTGYASLGLFYNGTIVKVYDRGPEWCQVEVGGKAGYMMARYLSFNGSVETTTPTVGIVNNPVATQRLNLRAFPNTSSLSLGKFYNGTRVKIITYNQDWCQVEVNGMKGYMMTKYLRVQ